MLQLAKGRLQVIRGNIRLRSTVLVWAAVLNCGGEAPRSRMSQRDSAGIRIVESTTPTWETDTGWLVDSVPALDLATSGSGTAHEFFHVRDATRLADGSIAVADGGSNEIRVFSTTGEFSVSIGRDGEGPGEFRSLSTVDRFGDDSLVAFDRGLRRLTVTSIDGSSVRVIPPYAPDIRLASVLPLTDSSFVGVTSAGRSDASDGRIRRGLMSVLRLSTTPGMLIDTITSMPGDESVAYSSGGFVALMVPLFPKASHVAVLRGDVVIGTADSLEYRVLSDDRRLRRIVRVPGYALDVSTTQVEEERAARLAAVSGMPEMFRDGIERLPRPATRPGYSDLKVDAEGCVWLAQYRFRSQVDQATAWEVFSQSGEWLGAVRTPPRFTVYEVGSDYVLGLWRDELDVEHVQLLRLHRH
jgi:hypothetical protein